MTQALYAKDSSLRQVLPEEVARHVSGLPKKAGGVATLLQWLRLVSAHGRRWSTRGALRA
jgi:hypothetical protein